jgi:hypothetical protein
MNTLVPTLPTLLNTIFVEMHPGDHKDFGAAQDYPLKGVTFVTEYGYLPGYTGEDGADLDFFVGSQKDGLCGSFIVYRPELEHGEHKFYVCMGEEELAATLKEYEPVVVNREPLNSLDELLLEIEKFKN